MRIAHIKTITILIAGAVFTAGLIMGFGGYVFAGENYNSSKSNTSTGIINRDVGNLLIDYGYGGEVINQVTEALARGVTTDELRAILSGTSARSPAVVEEVLQKLEVELERLGIRFQDDKDSTQAVSAPDAGDTAQPANGTVKDVNPPQRAGEVSTPNTVDTAQPGEGNIININKPQKGEVSNPDTEDASQQPLNSYSQQNSRGQTYQAKNAASPNSRAEAHQSAVAKVVQGLTDIAGKDVNIGEEVRKVAREQEASNDHSTDAIGAIEKRSGFVTFLFGTDYKNIGRLRSELETTKNHIDRLTRAIARTEDPEVKAELNTEIIALEQINTDAESFIKTNESKFSLFGWLTRLF